MDHTPRPHNVNPLDLLVAAIADAVVERLRATPSTQPTEWLDEVQMSAEYGLYRSSADARGIPRTRIGRKK